MQIVKVGSSYVKTKGCELAPNKIIEALKNIHSKENGEIIEFEKTRLEEIHLNNENPSEAEFLIFQNSQEILEKNFKSFFIGGDHSISYPIIKAFNKLEANPLLLAFDAHADCLENSKNRGWLRKLIESGFNPNNVILVSTRNVSSSETEFLKENKMLLIRMDIISEDVEGICDLLMERARKASGFYISIDIGAIDPGFAPGTMDLEPGGISSSEMIYFIKRLRLLKNFKGGDITEINPQIDFNNMTVKLGARLLTEMM